MRFSLGTRIWQLVLGCCLAASCGLAIAQTAGDGATRPDRDQLPQPIYKLANKNVESSDVGRPPAAAAAGAAEPGAAAENEHPLMPALRIAYSCRETLKGIKDYTAKLVKHERIGGKLQEPESMFIKVRQQPFSVYLYFLSPESKKGQECIYIAGQNGGNMLAHGVGIRKIAGTVSLLPTGPMAMSGQRYPITEIGIGNLTKRLIEVAENDKQFGECEVKFFKGAKINGRPCLCIQVTHPVPRKNFLFNVARVFIDDEMNVPVRYEAYEWPDTPGGQPQLLEEYTYVDVKLNVGLTDMDFNPKNPDYNF